MRTPIASLAPVTLATALLAAPALCQAQAWPSKQIRFITQNTAGAPADLYYRIIGDGLSQALGQPVITENRPGAGGVVAVEAISKSPPDGYTLGMGAAAPLAVSPLLRPAPYDPIKGFSHISMAFVSTMVLAVGASTKINSIPELLAYARANPGKLNYGTNGPGSTPHLATEWLKLKEGVDMVHIPFKSDADYQQSWRSGAIQLSIYGGQTLAPLEKQGVVKMLAALSSTRDPTVPNVPSAVEAGIPDFLVDSWGSVIGPAGLPRDMQLRVQRAMAAHLARPDVQAKVAATLYTPKVTTPEETLSILTTQIARWKDVIDRAKIKTE